MERKLLSELGTSRILRTLPRDKAFYFFTSIGNYTGESAESLEEFIKKILDVNVKSLEFHLYRGDFERWIADALEDNVLARKIKQLKTLKPIGIDLRDRLYLIVSKYFEVLTKPKTKPTSSTFTNTKPVTITFGKHESDESMETKARE